MDVLARRTADPVVDILTRRNKEPVVDIFEIVLTGPVMCNVSVSWRQSYYFLLIMLSVRMLSQAGQKVISPSQCER